MYNHSFYYYFGTGVLLLLFLFYKKLRRPKIYWIALLCCSIIAMLGFSVIDNPKLKMVHGNAASWLFLPLFFLIYFSLLRLAFLKINKNEPIMAAYRASSWEQGEYRKLHFGDVIFTILTLFLPFITLIFIDNFFK